MEVVEKGQMFIEKGNDYVFDHLKVILRTADDEYFYAKTSTRSLQININELDMTPIPAEHIWPLAEPRFTRAPTPLPSTCYLKRPRLLYYENTRSESDYACHILTDVEACEILRNNPHPNLAQYWGCVVKDGRIRGLCFTKYSMTLSQMLKDEIPFERSRCLRGIEAGVRHMHGLGLVHNDLNLSNIMMEGDCPVIIDFDSCKREGHKLGSKTGTLDGENYAKRDNDLYNLSEIRAALLNEN